jgi:ATP-dependent helicase/nuclease subunit B
MKKVFSIPFGADFLDALHRLIMADGRELSSLAIVFAGKRPSLYLKKRFSEGAEKPIYSPQFFSIEEFIDFIARKQYPDFTDIEYADAIWLLYQCIQSLPSFAGHPFREKGFGDFFWWGRYLLEFINQLDTENIDNDKLRSLEKNAELGYDVPESTNELLTHVILLRDAFHRTLHVKRFFTKGYKNLCALRRISKSIPDDFEKIYFAGLFAYTNTEKIIIQRIWSAGKGEIVLEGDPSQWPILTNLLSFLKAEAQTLICNAPPQNIMIHSGIDTHSEILTTYGILKETPPGRVAVVLPSPEALFPLLSFTIDRIDRPYNISLGYPLSRTSLFDLINHVLNAQTQKRKHYTKLHSKAHRGGDEEPTLPAGGQAQARAKRVEGAAPSGFAGGGGDVSPSNRGERRGDNEGESMKAAWYEQYPTAEYLSIMLHPFVKNLDMEGDIRPILSTLEKLFSEDVLENTVANKPFITLAEIEEVILKERVDANFNKIHRAFFQNFETANTLYEYAGLLGDLLEFILHHTAVRSYVLSGEIFREFYDALENLKKTQFGTSILHENDAENRRVICDFIREYLKSMKLPFETKPIEDLEIIGVLESRNISFDTIIMLDVNEGIMPQAKKINPLIPLGIYDLLGIPSPEYNEEIFRYYFYRLIRSARNIHLLYIDSEEKPRSRYIEQLIWEQERATQTIGVIKVDKKTYKINVRLQSALPVIEKTEKVRNIVQKKTFSPSAIDDYVTCPVLFYYKQILRFEELNGASEEIDAVDRGKIIHSILHDTFDGYIDREITPPLYKEILLKMRGVMTKYFETRETSGDYYLFKKLAAFKLESFLRKNIEDAGNPFVLKHLEARIENIIDVDGRRIKMKGRIDRVDYFPHNNEYMIFDYKTGGTKQYPRSALKRVDFRSMEEIHRYVNSFQLPIYIYLFTNHFDIPLADTNAKLMLLRNNDEEKLFNDGGPEEKEAAFAQYMEGITTVIKELLDPSKPFAPFDTGNCSICAFNDLCHV